MSFPSCIDKSLYQLPDLASHYLGTLFIPNEKIQDGRDYNHYKIALTYLRCIENVCKRPNLFRREIPQIQNKIDDYDKQVLLPEYSYPQCPVPVINADTMGNVLETEIRIADDRNFYVIEARFPLQDHEHVVVEIHSKWMEFYGEFDSVKISLCRKGLVTRSSCSPSIAQGDGSFSRSKRTAVNSHNETWISPKKKNKRAFDMSRQPDIVSCHGKIRIFVNKASKRAMQRAS